MASNQGDVEKIRQETVAMLRAVLISSPLGVRFDKLFRDYKELTFKIIPFKELGYPNLETFLQSIPDVARVEKGPDNEWVVKGVASGADKHVAKLISKQKKPKIRKSAKSAKMMVSRRKVTPAVTKQQRTHAPLLASIPRPAAPKSGSGAPRFIPPRMQRLKQSQNNPSVAPSYTRSGSSSEGHGVLFNKATNSLRSSVAPNASKRRSSSSSSNSQEKVSQMRGGHAGFQNMSVNISNASKEKDARVVTMSSPDLPSACDVLNDQASVKWMKAEIGKVTAGLWASRLQHLYKEKFKRLLPDNTINEMKFRPDIARVDQPIPGKFLLYPAVEQEIVQVEIRRRSLSDLELPCDLPEAGATITVYITHIESPQLFHVSKTDAISGTLSEAILKGYESSHYNADAIPSVSPGQLFCARFSQDDSFYRARILEVVDRKNVRVRYVDFGNTEIIPVEDLRVLISDFQTQPIQAFQCCLDGVQPADKHETWSTSATETFHTLTADKELNMTVNDVEDKVLCVSLYDESSRIDVAEELKKAGLAVSTKNLDSTPSSSSSSLSSSSGAALEKPLSPRTELTNRSRRMKAKSPGVIALPEDDFLDVFVGHIAGTYDMYLRLVGDAYSEKLEAMEESMTCYYTDSAEEVVSEPAVGDLFALLSDEVWCRVKVIGVNDGVIRVHFVDHGDTTETRKANLRILAPHFRQLPFQAFQCALSDLPKTKNPDVVDKLQKLVLGEVCVAEVIKRTSELTFVEIIDTRNNANISVNSVVRKLVIPDEELKPILPKVGEIADVHIAWISPTGSVFLHVSLAGINRLEELNLDLTEHYTSKRSKASEFISQPTPGKVCCAKYEDRYWYRAKIISSADKHAVEVLFVDYGNTSVVPSTSLREPTQANDHVLSLPFQALECQLYDVPKDAWSEDLIERIYEIVEQGTLAAEVMSDENLPSVSLLVNIQGETGKTETHRLTSLLGIATAFETNGHDDIAAAEAENCDDFIGNENEAKGEEKLPLHEDVFSDRQESVSGEDGVTGSPVAETQNLSAGIASLENENGGCATEDVQADVGKEIQPFSQWKPLQLDTGWIDVVVTEFRDIDHFTFQILKNVAELDELSLKMQEYYQKENMESNVELKKGMVYAVSSEDDFYYRAIVENVMDSERACVWFLDYGGFEIVGKYEMRTMEERFLQLPFQGVAAHLHGIKCCKSKWPGACIKQFKFMTLDRCLVAKVKSGHVEYCYGQTSDVAVELYDTSDEGKDVLIAEELIRQYPNAAKLPE